MYKVVHALLLTTFLLMLSCGNMSNQNELGCHGDTMVAKDMKDFTKDKDFKEAHELKDDIPFEPKAL